MKKKNEIHFECQRLTDNQRIGKAIYTRPTPRSQESTDEHGSGKQNLKWRVHPFITLKTLIAGGLFGLVAVAAAIDQQWFLSAFFILLVIFPLFRCLVESGQVAANFRIAIQNIEHELKKHLTEIHQKLEADTTEADFIKMGTEE